MSLNVWLSGLGEREWKVKAMVCQHVPKKMVMYLYRTGGKQEREHLMTLNSGLPMQNVLVKDPSVPYNPGGRWLNRAQKTPNR